MKNKNNSWEYSLAKLFKDRNNPVEFKPQEAIVINLDPVKVSILNGKVILEENKHLIITEWFQKRWDIDKTFALSEDIPDLLDDDIPGLITLAKSAMQQATASDIMRCTGGTPCDVNDALDQVSLAIDKVSEAIEKASEAIAINKTELLQLKLDLQLNDRVLIVPAEKEDMFFLVDKIL